MTDEKDEIRFLANTAVWPLYPWLPVKRRKKTDNPQCALIHAATPNRIVLTNLMSLKETLDGLNALREGTVDERLDSTLGAFEKLDHIDYDNPEAMVADGWIAD